MDSNHHDSNSARTEPDRGTTAMLSSRKGVNTKPDKTSCPQCHRLTSSRNARGFTITINAFSTIERGCTFYANSTLNTKKDTDGKATTTTDTANTLNVGKNWYEY